MLAAASRHDTWVLTVPESIPAVEAAIRVDPRRSKLHLEGIEFKSGGERLDRLTAPAFHWGYDRWQRAAAVRARQLDLEIDFDVVHHVTLASYWTRAGVVALNKPLVWGPIGGGVDPPLRLMTELGLRGVVEAMARVLGRPLVARTFPIRKTQRQAAVILAQNPGTGRRLRTPGILTLLSNALAVDLHPVEQPGARSSDVLFVGRLLPWKAPMLALRAFRYLKHPEAVLRFCGDGPEQARLERAASRWGLSGRVRFEGWLPRRDLLARLRCAGALIHPAVHEEAGLCIAEALTLGTPVVCLDHGGPAELVGQWPGSNSCLITPRTPESTARSMAAAIDRFLLEHPTVPKDSSPATTSFQEEVLGAYDVAASSRTG
jgi:glycosyltransferase involved in cell wall biosynthesis